MDVSGVDAGGPVDVPVVDTGVDVVSDAGVDAGPCGPSCVAPMFCVLGM
jgi:hypothetical protein